MFFIILIAGVLLVAADQLIKHWAVADLMPVTRMDFIKFGDFDILGLRYAENDGAAFGSFSGAVNLLIILNAAIIVLLLVITWKRLKDSRFLQITEMMVISGGIGNNIDRVRLGYVVDYLEVRMFRFAIFNLADILVVCGTFMLLAYYIYAEIQEKKTAVKSADADAE